MHVTRRTTFWLLPGLTALCGVYLAGCLSPSSSPQTRYYQLQAAPVSDAPAAPLAAGVSVRVGPVDVAPYLDRRLIVTRIGKHELVYDEAHRWAEPLDKNVSAVLVENLIAILRTNEVRPYTAASVRRGGLRVPVRILRLERTDGNEVFLHAAWSVRAPDAADQARPRHARLRRRLAPRSGIAAAVAAQSALLSELSVLIARDIADPPAHREGACAPGRTLPVISTGGTDVAVYEVDFTLGSPRLP